MGKITGFIELQRIQEAALPVAERVTILPRVRARAGRRGRVEAGRAVHGLRHSVLPERLPDQQRHPGLERSRLSQGLEDGARRAAHDQQFSGVHRTRLPGALRGGVHAQHQQRSGRHQVDRAFHHRQGLGGGLGRRRSPRWRKPEAASQWWARVPAGLACAQQLARAGHEVVVFEKSDRIGGLLRYGIPDFKMEKHLIDRRMAQMSIEGVEFRPSVARRQGRARREALVRVRRDRARRRGRGAARPSRAGTRARRHAFRDGFPAAAEQGRRRRRGRRRRSSRPASTSS